MINVYNERIVFAGNGQGSIEIFVDSSGNVHAYVDGFRFIKFKRAKKPSVVVYCTDRISGQKLGFISMRNIVNHVKIEFLKMKRHIRKRHDNSDLKRYESYKWFDYVLDHPYWIEDAPRMANFVETGRTYVCRKCGSARHIDFEGDKEVCQKCKKRKEKKTDNRLKHECREDCFWKEECANKDDMYGMWSACYDCGSSIPGHHTPSCELGGPTDEYDLPEVPGTQ